ncbi:hypothetical protein GHO35_13535 [Pseudomonas helleri]|uniref:hypothetical protein n=1 Tax=Pseudomonas helleri TaxID=1608996 RepID=UPI00129703F7|nr:hypothetical protein [Pseudomonas helleri]MQU22162.1 hypothetical protein [Pseudomonas helleri]
MQQGSEVSHITHKPPVEAARTLAIQKQRVIAVKEVSSLLSTMQYMALYCIDQNHVTLDHMETMADTLGILQRQVAALHLELAS